MAEIHQLLGVALSTPEEGMKAAYRRMAFKLHPDTGGATADVERFKALSAAWNSRRIAAQRTMHQPVRRTKKDPTDFANFF